MKALILCAHREVSLPTVVSMINLLGSQRDWHVLLETGDALISRGRSIAASRWLMNFPNDDVFLMIDDDFQFHPDAAEAVVAIAREKKGIAAGVTPLRSGEFTAIVPLGEETELEPWQDPRLAPMQVKWAGGFLAYHRSVFEKLSETMPLLHENDSIPAFWPFFMPSVARAPDGRGIYLSEDYACHERARQAGFTVWVVPSAQIGHVGQVTITVQNMPVLRQLGRVAITA